MSTNFGKPIGLRLTEDFDKKIRKLADHYRLPPSSYIRMLLEVKFGKEIKLEHAKTRRVAKK